MDNKVYFVAGCPRSATSIFSWALAEHKDLTTSEESNFLFYLLRDTTSSLYLAYNTAKKVNDGWFNKHNVGQNEYLEYIGLGIKKMFIDKCNSNIFIEQSPENILIADKILIMFPSARIINMIIDGREVVSSMLKSGFASPWSKDFKLACETWSHFVKKGWDFSQKYPKNILNVYQKDLVYDTKNIVKKVYAFLELDYEEKAVEYLLTKRVNSSYGNDEKNNFKTVKDTDLLKKPQWENWSNFEKKKFEEIAGDTMKLIGLY